MKAVKAFFLIVLLLGWGTVTATSQARYDTVMMAWPELLDLPPDPWTAPIQWFVGTHTAFSSTGRDQIAAARLRLRMIQKEVQETSANEWAGIYTIYATEIAHVVFAFAPQAGFLAFETVGCGASIEKIIMGKVAFHGTSLKLLPDETQTLINQAWNNHLFPRSISPDVTYIPTKWGKAHFLVSERQIASFCKDFIVGGKDYRAATTFPPRPLMKLYGAVEDDTLPPILPAKYSRLAKRPIVATVKKIGRTQLRRDKESPADWVMVREVVLDSGAAQGIKKGMQFITLGRDLKDKVQLQITRVGAAYSIGRYELYIPAEIKKHVTDFEAFLKENRLPRQGIKFRTYSMWYDIEGI